MNSFGRRRGIACYVRRATSDRRLSHSRFAVCSQDRSHSRPFATKTVRAKIEVVRASAAITNLARSGACGASAPFARPLSPKLIMTVVTLVKFTPGVSTARLRGRLSSKGQPGQGVKAGSERVAAERGQCSDGALTHESLAEYGNKPRFWPIPRLTAARPNRFGDKRLKGDSQR